MTEAPSPAAESPHGVSPARSILNRPWARVGLSVLGGVVAVVVVALVVRYATVGRYMQSTDDAYVGADVVTVSPRIAGTVEGVLVNENQWVEAGQALVRISGKDYRSVQNEAFSQAASAEASARSVTAGIAEQQAAIVGARAQLSAARAALLHAQGEVDRYTPLAGMGAETEVQLSQLRSARDQAVARFRAQEAAVLAQQRRIATLEAQRDQALAQGRAAGDQAAAAGVDVDATIVRASISGRVGDQTVRVGQTVQAGTPMMSIVPVRRLYVDARLKETQMELVRQGQPVTLSVDALPGVKLHGVVESMAPATSGQFALIPPQNATGNFTKVVQRVAVRIRLEAGPEARRVLVPGLSVTATVDTRNGRDAAQRVQREADARAR
jgi:membrane fusion protein, multidrug efflux system